MADLDLMGYTQLSEADTTTFLESSIVLLDMVFNTPNSEFSNHLIQNKLALRLNPQRYMADMFKAAEDSTDVLNKYQRGFLDYARVNYDTILKWYKKNDNTVAMSKKQLDWFKRWFTKNGLPVDCLKPAPVVSANIIVPQQHSVKPLFGGTV